MVRELPEGIDPEWADGPVFRLAAATARNARRRNEDAIGLSGWVLSGEPGFVVDLTVPTERHPSDAPPDSAAGAAAFGGARRPVLVAVTDGVGGAPDGDVAARLGAQILTAPAEFPEDEAAQSGKQALGERFERADAAIREAGRDGRSGMACSAALIEFRPDGTALIGHTGDVRVYRAAESYVGQLTEDHRSLLDEGAITRCIGGLHRTTSSKPEVATLRLGIADRFILCSDGIHDVLPLAEIRRCALLAEPRDAAEALVAAASASAQDTGHGDNATVAVIDVLYGGQRVPTSPSNQRGLAPQPASAGDTADPTPSEARRHGIRRRKKS